MVAVVLGIHRGGTSAIGGVLHHLGVHVGDDLIGPGHGNPTGHFEDREFVQIHDSIVGDWKDPSVDFEPYREEYTTLVSGKQCRETWGVKDPRMCFVFPYFSEIALDIRVISVSRDRDACATSLFTRGGHTLDEAVIISDRYVKQKTISLNGFTGPVLDVQYDHLVDHPHGTVADIARFVGVTPTRSACDFVDPSLRHWGQP